MPLTLFLVRHGRTVYNDTARMQGWCDSPITADGLRMVRATAHMLAHQPLDAVWTSPSGRAVETAQEILAHHPNTPLHVDDNLRELSFGSDEARREAEVFAQRDIYQTFHDVLTGDTTSFPGGENGLEFRTRVRSAFTTIENHHPDGCVAVISHGVTLTTYLSLISESPLITSLANASVSTVSIDQGKPSIIEVNALPHDMSIP
ncbi:histidine phosphatase family protein [Jonesia quinghaiensis]|uniref:histidine phosphatase family protein n=1 Tax=Jonesia quinghaiensis TaxID=262806 RepID=UPI00041EB0B1|nr:histidine phosphatase family protein [Jonesia quinghaiensis]